MKPLSLTVNNLVIGDHLVPKRGREGNAGHVKTVADRIKDYVVQPLVITNAYRGDEAFAVILQDGLKLTLPLKTLQADWKRP